MTILAPRAVQDLTESCWSRNWASLCGDDNPLRAHKLVPHMLLVALYYTEDVLLSA